MRNEKIQNYNLKIKLVFLSLLISCYLFPVTQIFASEYILPYPSYMPGHKLYKIEQIWNILQKYWHFGNIAKFKYYMGISDKKLIEAKTLFEYKQYQLAVQALEESGKNYKQARKYLKKAQAQGKKLDKQRALFVSAGQKHIQVLKKLQNNLPDDFIWKEEKKEPKKLKLKVKLSNAIKKRKL